MDRKRDTLKRFVDVLHPIRVIYDLPAATLHIFSDTSGDLIAFNRSGSIFLNLRYYEAWRAYMFYRKNLQTDISRS